MKLKIVIPVGIIVVGVGAFAFMKLYKAHLITKIIEKFDLENTPDDRLAIGEDQNIRKLRELLKTEI